MRQLLILLLTTVLAFGQSKTPIKNGVLQSNWTLPSSTL